MRLNTYRLSHEPATRWAGRRCAAGSLHEREVGHVRGRSAKWRAEWTRPRLMTHFAGYMKGYPMFPETPAAAAALSVATRFHSPALLNHSVRCYLWGRMYGTAHGIAVDDELFYVSALLHDIGLTEAFDNYKLPFEVAGGHLAWTFGLAAGWPEERATRAAEIIVTHMRDDVSPAADPESHLLQVATSWEAVGRHPEEFPPDARTEMLARYPWLGFGTEVLANFEDQARRKPDSACAASVGKKDMAGRVAANPLQGHPPA